MPVTATDWTRYKSALVTNQAGNGGRMGRAQAGDGRHAVFPRVGRALREAGGSVYRKLFLANQHAGDETAYATLVYFETPSTAQDRFLMALGTQTDTQAEALGYAAWVGCGQLAVALAGGETSVQLAMEAADAVFPNGGLLHLANHFKAGQTVAAGVGIGDYVTWDTGSSSWIKAASGESVIYPGGLYLGSGLVLTDDAAAEEWLRLADNLYSNEVIGTGNGSSQSPALTTLAHHANGICALTGKLPVVTATCGAVSRTVNVAADGSCSGYCTAGQLDMATGAWTTAITWSTAPDNGSQVKATYRENCYGYSGNTATVQLTDTVANAYATATTFASGCLEAGDVAPSVTDWAETSAAGTYNEGTYPVQLYNDGVEEELVTVTFTGTGVFSVSGLYAGSLGTGSTGTDFAPTNPATGQPYFRLKAAGWGGTWAVGETIVFRTHPGAVPLWLREIIPAGTPAAPDNLVLWGWYNE